MFLVSKNAYFPLLVLAIKLSLEECVQCVQITYLAATKCLSLSNETSVQSAENTTHREMQLISRYKRLR